MLTILGVILYLRMGWVVANAGLVGTLIIVVLAHVITVTTSFSLSALATSMRVGERGSLLVDLTQYGARARRRSRHSLVSLPGAEPDAVFVWLGGEYPHRLARCPRSALLAAAIVILVVLLAVKSTVLALRMQLPIMVLIGVSIGALVSGTDFGGMQVPMFASSARRLLGGIRSLLPSGDGYPGGPRPQR